MPNVKPELIFIESVLKETIWGGSRLSDFGYSLPSQTVGEAWVVSAHPNGDCKVLGDSSGGMTLSQLWKEKPYLFGRSENICEPFPLLTKIIDARSDLSIQVHPDDEYARLNENGSLGKTECWYILDAEPESKIIIGHKARSRNHLAELIEKGQWNDFIREVPVRKGDFFFIEPGTVHAIKGGTLILETQQSSDITYRVYDYGRLQNGKSRQLHIRQSLDVIKCPYVPEPVPVDESRTCNKSLVPLVNCSKFSVWHAKTEDSLKLVQDQDFMIVSVVEGKGYADGTEIRKGSNFIIPKGYGTVTFSGAMEFIVSSQG